MSPSDPPPSALQPAVSPAAETRPRRAARRTGGVAPAGAGPRAEVLRKPVNALAIVPRSHRITYLARKAYNVLLYEAQEQGLEKDVFRTTLDRVIRGVEFDSNDTALVKKHLRAMVSTTVEWQSPTAGEGTAWNVSGLLAHARLTKERGQVWVDWSYAVNLKQELLEPTVFARLKLEVISQLRSHAGVALYEICARYRDIGRTARHPWRWWHPVLTGQPPDEAKLAKAEYRIFKRDVLRGAVAEVSAVSDLDIELVEHKAGRFIEDVQFLIRTKRQGALPLAETRAPVDLSLLAQARRLGLADETTERLIEQHGEAALRQALPALERRLASAYPEPLRDAARYLKVLLGNGPAVPAGDGRDEAPVVEAAVAGQGGGAAERRPARPAATVEGGPIRAGAPVAAGAAAASALAALAPTGAAGGAAASPVPKQRARWIEEWRRRRQLALQAEIERLAPDALAALVAQVDADFVRRGVHPSFRKRLQASGWRHPLIVGDVLRIHAQGAYGEGWDQPSAEDLLAIAAETGRLEP